MSPFASIHTKLHRFSRSTLRPPTFWGSDAGTALIALGLTVPVVLTALLAALVVVNTLNLAYALLS